MDVENTGAIFRAERAEAENDLDLTTIIFLRDFLFSKKDMFQKCENLME